MNSLDLALESSENASTGDIIYAIAVSDSEDGIVKVVFGETEKFDDDGESIADVYVEDEDDTADSIDDDADEIEDEILYFDDSEEEE